MKSKTNTGITGFLPPPGKKLSVHSEINDQLDERIRRLLMAAEAKAGGYGSITLSCKRQQGFSEDH